MRIRGALPCLLWSSILCQGTLGFHAIGIRRTPRIVSLQQQTQNDSTTTEQVQNDAKEALKSVGWSLPEEGDLTSDDPFVRAIDTGIRADTGVSLDELLNPAKVVNLERDLYQYRTELAELTGVTVLPELSSALDLTTAMCDGGGGGEVADALREKIAKKEKDLALERRSVFRGWLKNLFLGQAILSRRPSGLEKKALDVAFLATPAISVVAPVFTKDTGVIWAANGAVVVLSYAYAYLLVGDDTDNDDSESSNQPAWLKFVFKSLDFGSGKERGVRK